MTYLSQADFATRTMLPQEDVAALSRLSFTSTGDTYAADTLAESNVGIAPIAGGSGQTIAQPTLTILISVSAPVVANDINNATISVYKRTAGGAAVLLAQGTTSTAGLGSLGTGVFYALPLQLNPANVAYGDQITVAYTKAGTGVVLPPLTVRAVVAPSYVEARILAREEQINSRLKKRYAVPFTVPIPECILFWEEALVTYDCFLRRGFNPGSAQDTEITKRAELAEAQIKEAADAKDGLFDLPYNQNNEGASAVSAGFPLGYTETSPYVWTDQERCNAEQEDCQRTGTGP